MKITRWLLCLACAFLMSSGCAFKRYSLREIQEYDQVIKVAESNHIDTTAAHKKLVEMFMSYMEHPGVDPYVQAALDASQGMEMMGAASAVQAINQTAAMYQSQPMPVPAPPPPFFRR